VKKNKDYPTSNPKFQVYHNQIDRLTLDSQILNNGGKTLGSNSRIFNRQGIETELLVLKGNKKGIFFKRDQEYPSSIRIAQIELSKIDENFKIYCENQVSIGRKRPEQLPQYMLDQKLTIEARIFVYESEVEELTKRLQPFIEADQEKSDKAVLPRGPVGSSQLSQGYIVSIDGLNVSTNSEGIPFIDDKRAGKFNGFSTAQYIEHICIPWSIAKNKIINKVLAEAKEKNISLADIPRNKLSGMTAPIPDFPKGIRNFLKEEVPETTMTRLK
jgi:hypothetical protein